MSYTPAIKSAMVLPLVTAAFSAVAPQAANAQFFPMPRRDHAGHAVVGATVYSVAQAFGFGRLGSFLACSAAGGAKEFLDSFGYGHVEASDFVATIAPCTAMALYREATRPQYENNTRYTLAGAADHFNFVQQARTGELGAVHSPTTSINRSTLDEEYAGIPEFALNITTSPWGRTGRFNVGF